jgi:hypothetical protein
MNDWLPCPYAAMLIGTSTVIAAVFGFYAGRMREQLALLELFRPWHNTVKGRWK